MSNDFFWTNPPRVTQNGNIGPTDSAQVPRFAGPATFALLPRLLDAKTSDARITVVPALGEG